jgi:hypothetical protein
MIGYIFKKWGREKIAAKSKYIPHIFHPFLERKATSNKIAQSK